MATVPAYENVGTATVTAGDVDVVGQGTRWSQCRPSDTFYGQAGERNIVQSIADDTHLKLLFPATIAQAAQGVAVMRTPDDVFTQTMARQVFQKISDSILVALAGMPVANRKGFRLGAVGAAETFDLSDFALSFLDDPNGTEVLKSLGLGNFILSLLDDPDAATALRTLGLNSIYGQSEAFIRLREGSGNQIEFGHSNGAGYASTLGYEGANGSPRLMFFAEAGTTVSTYRTRGKPGIGIRGNPTDGGLDIIRAALAAADNQTASVIARFDPDGTIRQGGNKLVDYGSTANGSYFRLASGAQVTWRLADMPAQAAGTQSSIAANLPAAFLDTSYTLVVVPIVALGGGSQSDIGKLLSNGLYYGPSSASTVGINSYSYNYTVTAPVRCVVVGFGRWL